MNLPVDEGQEIARVLLRCEPFEPEIAEVEITKVRGIATVAETALKFAWSDRRTKITCLLAVGAARDRICEQSGFGLSLGGVPHWALTSSPARRRRAVAAPLVAEVFRFALRVGDAEPPRPISSGYWSR